MGISSNINPSLVFDNNSQGSLVQFNVEHVKLSESFII